MLTPAEADAIVEAHAAAAAAAAYKPMHWTQRTGIRAIYCAGVVGTGYALWDLLVTQGRFEPIAAVGIVLIVELFTISSARYSTRSRLRGETDLFTRTVVYLGALGSASMQVAFHWQDNRVVAVLLPLASVLSLIMWMLDVKDMHARVFANQAAELRRKRKERRERRREFMAYVVAVGPFGKKADPKNGIPAKPGAIGWWRERTAELGIERRRASHDVAMADQAAVREIGIGRAEAAIEAANDGGYVAPAGPFPPRQVRPTSAPPASTVVGEGPLADFLRDAPTYTEAARRLMAAWYTNYQENRTELFGVSYSVVSSAAAMVRLLKQFGVTLTPGTVSVVKQDLIKAGRFPNADEGARIANTVDAIVVEPEAIAAR